MRDLAKIGCSARDEWDPLLGMFARLTGPPREMRDPRDDERTSTAQQLAVDTEADKMYRAQLHRIHVGAYLRSIVRV
jgi:hypothetical protein